MDVDVDADSNPKCSDSIMSVTDKEGLLIEFEPTTVLLDGV